jgi:lysophospholipase L1-like esterase
MADGIAPNDIFHNGYWYNRDGSSGPATQSYVQQVSKLPNKIRASIAKANSGNVLTNIPLINTKTGQSIAAANTVPDTIAWRALTFYNQGAVIKNGTNLYMSKNGGISGAASPPTGTGNALIADGTVSWYFVGIQQVTTDDPLAPVVTYQAPVSLPQVIPVFANSQLFTIAGGSTLTNANSYCQALAITQTGNTKITNNGQCIHFMTDAPIINLNGDLPFYGGAGGYYLRIAIDDRFVTLSSMALATLINPAGVTLDFTASGGRKPRKISVYTPTNFGVSQVAIDNASKIWPIQNANRFRLAVWGDSLTQGGDGTPYGCGMDLASQLGMLLGTDQWVNLGVGSTGFIQTNSGTKNNYIQRVNDVISYAPDLLIVCGNHNDNSFPSVDRQVAILLWLQTVRSALPNTIIIVAGTMLLQNEASSAMTVPEADMKSAFTTWSDSNSYYLAIDQDPTGRWLYGTGSATAPANVAGMNYDAYNNGAGDAHPNQRGVNYMAYRYANAISAIFNT